jgi:hypothetical protein
VPLPDCLYRRRWARGRKVGRALERQKLVDRPAPSRAGATDGGLTGVSCASPAACTAVGYDAAGSLAVRWNGRRWSIQLIPRLSGALTGVSCASNAACTAVAEFGCVDCLGTPSQLFLAAGWDGTAWSIQRIPNRAVSTGTSLLGVSCVSPTACIAVGSYRDPVGVVVTLALRWNGRRWSIQPTPNPAGAGHGTLEAVSCASTTACTAVGSPRMLIERWNGTRWSIQPNPMPAGATGGTLTGVSCASPTDCIAVGNYLHASVPSSQAAPLPLIERWNGRRWSIQPTPTPTGATSSTLTAVSCNSPTTCTAVGHYTNEPGDELTLVERWTGTG